MNRSTKVMSLCTKVAAVYIGVIIVMCGLIITCMITKARTDDSYTTEKIEDPAAPTYAPEINTIGTNWNKGVCELCGGDLVYESCGRKYHYYCDNCGREYTFDSLQSKK